MLRVVREQRLAERHQLADARIRDTIDDRAILAASDDESAPAQAAEMRRDRGLRHAQAAHELTRRQLAGLVEQAEDAQPGRIAKAAEVLAEQVRTGRRLGECEGKALDASVVYDIGILRCKALRN